MGLLSWSTMGISSMRYSWVIWTASRTRWASVRCLGFLVMTDWMGCCRARFPCSRSSRLRSASVKMPASLPCLSVMSRAPARRLLVSLLSFASW